MKMHEERQLGRAKNAIMAFLERRLSVPKIYVDATWEGVHVDLLAIDRDGVGDVAVVLMFVRRYWENGSLDPSHVDTIGNLIDRLSNISAHIKYIAAVDTESDHHTAVLKITGSNFENSFATDGLGRIGFLKVEVPDDEDEPAVHLVIKPERFRAAVYKLADEYVAKHEADWEIRA